MNGRWMVEGAVGGTIGAGVLAVWFLLYDMAEGQPLRTPALLAAALFHGLRDVGALHITLLLLFCCFEVFILALVTILAEWLFEALAWWATVLGNLAASAGMLAFFWRRHRLAWRAFISAAS